MAKCSRCHAETQLHVSNIPICPKCAGEVERADAVAAIINPLCSERTRLFEEYEQRAQIFSAAVAQLESTHGADFGKIYDETEVIRREAESAFVALVDHILEHGCGPGAGSSLNSLP